MNGTVLVHYGKKGMKWGERHSPKPSNHHEMTPDEMRKTIQDVSLRNQYAKVTKKGPDNYEKAQQVINIGNESVKIGNTLNGLAARNRKKTHIKSFDTSHMTDAQLQKKIQRMNMENQYSRLMQEPETISRGQERIDRALDIGGATLATASSVLGIALAIKTLTGN